MRLTHAEYHTLLIAASAVFFVAVFFAAWRLSNRCVPSFRTMLPHQKADWSSRASSTVHAAGSVGLALYCLATQSWSGDYEVMGPVNPWIFVCFSFSTGFFLSDLIIILSWQVASWTLFVCHHVVAAIPYLIALYNPECPCGYFILVSFLLVELSTLPLNAASALEQLGLAHTASHRSAFLTMYMSWVVARVVWPAFLMSIVYGRFLLRPPMPQCLIPACVCAHLITFFCWYVFFFVWTPELIRKLVVPRGCINEELASPIVTKIDEEQPLLRLNASFDDLNLLSSVHKWENTIRAETLSRARSFHTLPPPPSWGMR